MLPADLSTSNERWRTHGHTDTPSLVSCWRWELTFRNDRGRAPPAGQEVRSAPLRRACARQAPQTTVYQSHVAPPYPSRNKIELEFD